MPVTGRPGPLGGHEHRELARRLEKDPDAVGVHAVDPPPVEHPEAAFDHRTTVVLRRSTPKDRERCELLLGHAGCRHAWRQTTVGRAERRMPAAGGCQRRTAEDESAGGEQARSA